MIPLVLCGVTVGGIFPFLVSAMTMTAVGDAAFEMIVEVRRQFREIPGLLEGTGKPDTARCVDIATRAALRKDGDARLNGSAGTGDYRVCSGSERRLAACSLAR